MLFAPKDANVLEYLQKTDSYGIGFDPYEHAEEFRGMKKGLSTGVQAKVNRPSRLGVTATASQMGSFGIGVFEEADDIEVYDADAMEKYDASIGDEQEPIVLRNPKRSVFKLLFFLKKKFETLT